MIYQYINQPCSCIDALALFFGFNDLECNLYFILVQSGDKTVSELCELVSRNQSTVYTALEKILSHSIINKNKRNREKGGYEYVYSAIDPQTVKKLLLEKLASLYDNVKSCLEEFDLEAQTCSISL